MGKGILGRALTLTNKVPVIRANKLDLGGTGSDRTRLKEA